MKIRAEENYYIKTGNILFIYQLQLLKFLPLAQITLQIDICKTIRANKFFPIEKIYKYIEIIRTDQNPGKPPEKNPGYATGKMGKYVNETFRQ